ncbi:YfkD family protein [Bacillus licheniformis]|nr:YfkD family protein [Bacillus licheniformis]
MQPKNWEIYTPMHLPSMKRKVTYGEVYIVLKATKKASRQNITSQGIGAWIPVQDHLTFGFQLSHQPK